MTASEREELIMSHLRHVHFHAKVYARRHVAPFEDLVSIGTIGLIVAVDRWQPDGGAQLASFSKFRIRGAMLDYLRTVEVPEPWDHATDDESGEPIGTMEAFADDPERSPAVLAEKSDLRSRLPFALARLSPRERAILHAYYAEDRTQEQIGRALGVNASRISQIRTKALRKLRAVLDRKGLGTRNEQAQATAA